MRELSMTNRLLRREISLNASKQQARYAQDLSPLRESVSSLERQVEWMKKNMDSQQERLATVQSQLSQLHEASQ